MYNAAREAASFRLNASSYFLWFVSSSSCRSCGSGVFIGFVQRMEWLSRCRKSASKLNGVSRVRLAVVARQPMRQQRSLEGIVTSCYYTIMDRTTVIEQLKATQEMLAKLLAHLESSEADKFVAHLYQARKQYRLVCERPNKGNKAIEREVISLHGRSYGSSRYRHRERTPPK